MNRLKEIKELRKKAEELHLDNAELLRRYNMQQLCSIYNGIGPDSFPEWLRSFISALHPSLAVVALIHDVEWHESDKKQREVCRVQHPFQGKRLQGRQSGIRLVQSPKIRCNEPSPTLWKLLQALRMGCLEFRLYLQGLSEKA